ncbi:unknown [Clostridium sp. CAG:632]|nr:unknown [Clostridium sp. CAG:632]
MKMMVPIYLESSLRGPARRSGTGAWLVEYVKPDGMPETRKMA